MNDRRNIDNRTKVNNRMADRIIKDLVGKTLLKIAIDKIERSQK